MASKGFHPLVFLFCQEMLMFKGNMFLVLFSFIKITVAEVLQRHRFLELWRSLKSFPINTLKIYSFSLITLEQSSDKIEKVIRECGQRSTATEKYQTAQLRNARQKLQFPFDILKTE